MRFQLGDQVRYTYRKLVYFSEADTYLTEGQIINYREGYYAILNRQGSVHFRKPEELTFLERGTPLSIEEMLTHSNEQVRHEGLFPRKDEPPQTFWTRVKMRLHLA